MARSSRLLALPLLGLVAFALGGCDGITVNDDDGGGDTPTPADGGSGVDDGDGGNGDGGNGDGGNGDGGGGGSAETPSTSDVDACRKSCDELLFFDCLDADTHAACYEVCPERSSSAIDLFNACTTNTLPTCGGCFENLVDASPPVSGDDTGGGAVPDCQGACEEWLGAGCPPLGEFDSCASFCASFPEPVRQAVVECVANRDGCMLPTECTFEESEGGGAGAEG